MTTHDGFGADEEGSVHDAVGAYVLGVLDDADATAFEEHLAECELCGARLEEFSGMEPMLALLADGPGRFAESGPLAGAQPPEPPLQAGPPQGARSGGLRAVPGPAAPEPVPAVSVRPSPELLDRLVDEVAAKRASRRRRTISLVAVAAVLIIGGPTAAVVATSNDGNGTTQVAEVQPGVAYFTSLKTKHSATDPVTKVSATIATEPKAWGTSAVMKLSNVKGPLKCRLVAVSKSGEQQVLATWSVPMWGYGIKNSPHVDARQPLYMQGGVALTPQDIDHFDVMTLDGKQLVQVPA
jgi:Putative zinc-finger